MVRHHWQQPLLRQLRPLQRPDQCQQHVLVVGGHRLAHRAQPLTVRDARPWHGGPLQLLSGPERIESGWWGGGSVARDYYVARAGNGARLWIYRARDVSGWFLHGVFA